MTHHLILHLIRHGRTEWNAAGKIQGHTNSDLTELGHRQAAAIGRALTHYPIEALYASDLDRAQQTAVGIRSALGLDVRTDPRLRETGFGIFEGLTWAEAEAEHPAVYRDYMTSAFEFEVPGGESRAQTLNRALSAFADYAKRHGGTQIAAVSHGGLMAYFLRHVLQMPMDSSRRFKTENGCICTFEFKKDRWRLLTWGAVAHLAGVDT